MNYLPACLAGLPCVQLPAPLVVGFARRLFSRATCFMMGAALVREFVDPAPLVAQVASFRCGTRTAPAQPSLGLHPWACDTSTAHTCTQCVARCMAHRQLMPA